MLSFFLLSPLQNLLLPQIYDFLLVVVQVTRWFLGITCVLTSRDDSLVSVSIVNSCN